MNEERKSDVCQMDDSFAKWLIVIGWVIVMVLTSGRTSPPLRNKSLRAAGQSEGKSE